jgi:signal transduction histidine kinase
MLLKNSLLQRSSPSSISLGNILVIPFLVQVFGAVSLVGYLSFQNGQKAVNQVASQLRLEISERVKGQLSGYLQTPHLATQVLADDVIAGRVNLKTQDFSTFGPYLMTRVQGFESIGFLKIADPQGQYVGVGRYEEQGKVLMNMDFADLNSDRQYITYQVDQQLQRIKPIADPFPYDARQRPWFASALKTNRPSWGPVYIIVGDPLLSITAVQSIYDARSNFLGVVGVDMYLGDITNFLRQLQVGKTGQVFITDKSGILVASSTSEKLYTYDTEKRTKLLMSLDSQNPLTKATAQAIHNKFQDLSHISTAESFAFTGEKGKQFVQVMPFQDKNGLDWLIVVVLPEADFMQQINENNRLTIFLCVLALIIAGAIGVFTSRWVVFPLDRLITAARAMKRGELDQHVEAKEVREIQILADTFNEMAQQLKESFVALQENQVALQQGKDKLEVRVEERTMELTKALVNLRQTQTQLIQTEKMSSLGQMVAGVAHEINNPVNFIYGNVTHAQEYSEAMFKVLDLYVKNYPSPAPEILEVMEESELDYLREDLPRILGSMKLGATRIQEIVRSLRTFSRLDESDMKDVDIHENLDSTLLILQNRFKAKNDHPEILIVKEYGNLPQVECYAGQLNQVFMNLLTNAIDALEERDRTLTPTQLAANPSQILIRTSLINPAQSKPQIQIAVIDNAQGMSPEVTAKIFDPFYTTKEIGKGTGLGLAISYQIVIDRHQGTLECHSQVGQGTEFVITIPTKTSFKAT